MCVDRVTFSTQSSLSAIAILERSLTTSFQGQSLFSSQDCFAPDSFEDLQFWWNACDLELNEGSAIPFWESRTSYSLSFDAACQPFFCSKAAYFSAQSLPGKTPCIFSGLVNSDFTLGLQVHIPKRDGVLISVENGIRICLHQNKLWVTSNPGTLESRTVIYDFDSSLRNSWVHLTWTQDSNTILFYIDNVVQVPTSEEGLNYTPTQLTFKNSHGTELMADTPTPDPITRQFEILKDGEICIGELCGISYRQIYGFRRVLTTPERSVIQNYVTNRTEL